MLPLKGRLPKSAFVIFLGILSGASLWDGFTTFYGTYTILGEGISKVIAALVFTFVVQGFLYMTKFIKETDFNNPFLGRSLNTLLLLSFVYDLYTSYIGNERFIVGGPATNNEQIVILIGLTLMLSCSPVLCSYLTVFVNEPT